MTLPNIFIIFNKAFLLKMEVIMKEKLNVSFKMEDDYLPPLKTLATISFVILLCSMPLFAFNGGIGEYVREYFGIIWHISMFFFINKLATPKWGKTAGIFWIVLDTLSGILYINNFYSILGDASLGIAVQNGLSLCLTIRLAAHCFEGIWLISSAFTTSNKVIKVCGVLAGTFIAGYSIISPFAPSWVLMLNVPFMIIWFFMIVIGKY